MVWGFMKKYTIVSDGKKSVLNEINTLNGRRDISIVIPSYNEEGNIIPMIKGITKALKDKYSFEIIWVDDNSKDKTKEILSKAALKDKNIVTVFREGIKGIWSAQLDGVRISRGKAIVLMDADMSHPPEVIPKLVEYLPEYHFVSASRYIKGGDISGMPWHHHMSTWIFNRLIRFLMAQGVRDYTCVFHAIKKDKLMQILPKGKSVAGEFDLDLFYHANKKRLKIKEIPYTYIYRKEGKSKSKSMLVLAWIYGWRALRLRFFGR